MDGAWADVHHLQAWADGGVTSIENAILLCRYYHQRIHDPRYLAERLPNGRYRIILRT